MRRDLDIVRQIMLQIEAHPVTPPVQFRTGELEDPVLLAHLQMMIAAGLVNGKVSQSTGARGDVIVISGLTWEGHEWIEIVRSPDVWNETKTTLMENGGALSFELSKAVATRILKVQLGLLGQAMPPVGTSAR